MRTTIGNLLINAALPKDLQRPKHFLDKKGVESLFREIAENYPNQYKDIAQKLMETGVYGAQAAGSTVNLSSTIPPPHIQKQLDELREKVKAIGQSEMPDDQKDQAIIKLVGSQVDHLDNAIYQHGIESGSPLAAQVLSGSRGNKVQLRQIVAGDLLVSDHKDRVLPVPILHGYSHGLDPVEYFAASYGARKGTVSTKFATQNAGFLAKQLAMASHRLVVTEHDCKTSNGIPTTAGDKSNAGTVLAQATHGLPVGHVLTAQDLKRLGDEPIVVRSPISCQSPHGICAKCAGVRETGKLPAIGDNIGLPSAQSISEKISQGSLSVKHSGGAVSGKEKAPFAGFNAVNALVQVPEHFKGAATVAEREGTVSGIEPAPQGGHYVHIGNTKHYVPADQDVVVKPHQLVEAGDALSDGVPNPADLVHHKGVGEGRLQFVNLMGKVLKDSGISANRRNLEVLSRGLINHVSVTDLDGVTDALPDDIVNYDSVARNYRPREGHQSLGPKQAVGRYLEAPALHYSIGTQVTPSVVNTLERHGIDQIDTHHEAPPFHPHMVRAMEQGMRDPNPITRLGASYLEKGMLESTHRSRSGPEHDTSFIPSLAKGVGFGKNLRETGLY